MPKKAENLRRIASSLIIALLLLSLCIFTLNVKPAKAQSGGTIYINSDGSITPPTANITTTDKVTYTFTGNNYLPIVVNRSNIIINGMDHTLQASASYDGFSLSSVSNVTIENTTITNSGTGISLYYSSNNTLSGNNVTANTDGIDLQFSSDNTLSGNNITSNSNDGIDFYSSSGNVLSGNNVTANSYNGIYLIYSCDNNTFSGNTITGNSGGDGIYLYASNKNILSGNNVTANKYGIIFDTNCGNNTLSGNNVIANDYDGFDLQYSSDNIFSRNNVTGNGGIGIGLYYSSSRNNTLSGNTIIGNGYGIYLGSFSGNRIFHNDFLNNTQQAYAYNSTNTWDNGYPSGGNYWSDYTGVDSYHGSSQNVAGPDGIGDTNYTIDANNVDRYPLMAPFKTFSVGTWNKTAYSVDIVCYSTITEPRFNPFATPPTLSFNVTGTGNKQAFCRVSIPTGLMWVQNPPDGWLVYVGGTLYGNSTIITSGNYTYIYFTYSPGTETVKITSTSAVTPELQPYMLLPLFMIITLLGAMILKRKRSIKK
jgi:parallel beta-helix repeat protein